MADIAVAPGGHGVRDTLKKSSFPRRRESSFLILLGFIFGKHDFSE